MHGSQMQQGMSHQTGAADPYQQKRQQEGYPYQQIGTRGGIIRISRKGCREVIRISRPGRGGIIRISGKGSREITLISRQELREAARGNNTETQSRTAERWRKIWSRWSVSFWRR